MIVGGGFTGLTAAYELSKQSGVSITLIESSDQLGGLAGGFCLLGTMLEKAYHHLFLTDTCILSLVEELGLSERLKWFDSSMGIYRDRRTHPFMTPMDLLRFSPCSLMGRLRVGATAFYLKKQKNWRGLITQRASEWMRRACGASAMATIWTPLLKGKFDEHADAVSMAWLWARIHSRSNSRKGVGGREQLGYFQGGFAALSSRLEERLRQRDVRIRLGTKVEGFKAGEQMLTCGGVSEAYDACIFTGSSAAFSGLLPADPQLVTYKEKLLSIKYLGALSLIFVSDQEVGEQYWLNVNEPDAPFLVFINHTRLVGKQWYQGRCVYYLGAYLPMESRFFAMSEDVLAAEWWVYLRKIFPAFDPVRVSERHVFRFKAAQHIVDTDYESRIPDYRTPLAGVFLSNFSQVFPHDRGTNWAVSEGQKIARMVLKEIGKQAT